MEKFVVIALLFCIGICFFPSASSSSAAYSTDKKKSKLVDLRKIDNTIVIDLRYATKNNFTKKKIYPVAVPLLRKETAEKLRKVNKEVDKKGYRIKVWDIYRPFSAQKTLYDAAPDKSFVGDPKKGSRHNRGAAADITLVDKEGKEILMPTGFDNFTPKASRNYKKMNKTAKKNMDYLTSVMTKHGFQTISNEWWHFDDTEWEKYPILNVPLTAFK